MSRSGADELRRFKQKWAHADYPPIAVTESELDSLERTFSILLPDDYREAVCTVGLVRPTIDLLQAIVERGLLVADLSDLFSPGEVVENTTGLQEVSLPRHLVAIANDCSGNLFCFSALELNERRTRHAKIHLWDHDFDTVELVAASFTDWIRQLADIKPIEPAHNDNQSGQ